MGIGEIGGIGEMDCELKRRAIGKIGKLLTIADAYGGQVFGGYVRSVIVPMLHNKPPDDWKDVDIWFENVENAEAFVRAAGRKVVESRAPYRRRTNTIPEYYPFEERIQLELHIDDRDGYVSIDVIVNKVFPVNDFYVNLLRYRYHQGVPTLSNQDTKLLHEHILSKKAVMMPQYATVMCEKDSGGYDGSSEKGYAALFRVSRSYLGRGWSVYVLGCNDPIRSYKEMSTKKLRRNLEECIRKSNQHRFTNQSNSLTSLKLLALVQIKLHSI